MEPNNQHLRSLLEKDDLINIIKGATCFKSSRGRCIDLILTNKRHSLMKTQSFETRFSDHHHRPCHHLIYTIFKKGLKTTYRKVPPIKLVYRNSKKWSEEHFMSDLMRNLQSMPTISYTNFETAFENALEANAPKKAKAIRGNNKPNVNRELRKAVMK